MVLVAASIARPFGASIRGQDADLAQTIGPPELPAATVGKTLRQVAGVRGELEQGEVLPGRGPKPLEHCAFLPIRSVAAPPVDDVVVVPHHQ